MSADVAIKVENLGKRYIISHQRAGGEGLRHVLQRKLSAPWRALRQRLGGQKSEARGQDPQSGNEEFWALRDVSFEIKRGAVVGIIGRNGAGKSTLLKILSRITEPATGRITIEGRVASLLEVGTGFHADLTGRENIFLNGAILGMSRAEIKCKFDEIVAFAEVERFLDTPVKRYSSGMYVRLAFAVAAHLEPEILVVDEVLAVGDAEFQRKCLGKMREVSTQHGRTVLFVSHQMAAVRRLCSQAMVLESGRTSGPVSVDEAIERYSRQAQNAPSDLDLANVRRAEPYGEVVRITRVRVAPDTPLCYAKPMEIQYTIECARPVRQVAVGIGFDTLDGQRVMTLDSDNSGPLIDLDAGANEVRLRIEYNPLHPGTYSCGVGVLSIRSVLDVLPACATWEIRSSEADLISDRGFAGCRMPVKVEVVAHAVKQKPVATLP